MRRFTFSAICLLLMLEMCGVAMAQDSFNISMLGEVHDFVEQSYDVAMSGDFAYIASGTTSGLRVLDLSDPTTPLEVGYSVNSDTCAGVELWMADRITVSGDNAYVLYFDGTWSFAHYRLYVYDVSNPSAPQQMGYVSLPDNCTSQFVDGDYVYISAFEFEGFSGIKVIDVSDPMQPVEVGSFETPGMPHDVFVTDNTAYVADNNALVIYDVTDPGFPTELGSYSPAGEIAFIHYVVVQGDYIYIIDSLFGVRILDASDFSQIHEVGSFPHNQTDAFFSRIEISGDFVYYLQDGDITGKQLVILDVSDPIAPLEINSHDLLGNWWFYGFDYRDGYACIAAGDYGLRVVDVSNHISIEEVGYYDPHGLTFGVAVSGDHAYISTNDDSENLLVYDVSDPSSPTEVNSLSFEGRPKWISTWENYLYIPGVEVALVSGVSVLDISDPAEPVEAAFLPCPQDHFGVPLSVDYHDNYVYVAMAFGGVQIYDVSQIDHPIALGNWTLWSPMTNQGFAVRNVKVSWPYLFVPDESYGLYVLDVSDPNNIVEVANYQIIGSAWWIDISPDQNYVYLADFTGELRIFDVSDPLAPAEIGFIEENLVQVNHVVSSGDSIYVTDNQGIGLHVYDVSNPTLPTEVAYHKTPGLNVIDIALANDLIYVSDRTHFEIFAFDVHAGVDDNPPSSLITDYRIHTVYPNPFNATTRIVFDIAKASHVTLQIFNSIGQKVQTLVDDHYQAGSHTYIFQANKLASGIYLLRLEADGGFDSHKLILMK
ncbi:T9SS type A sorting domain-containing protein [Candidatus Neomarinimicrobiota bacterium]